MTVPALPAGLENLRGFLDDLEGRVGLLEAPQSPGQVYACLKAKLPSAAAFTGCVVRITDPAINILVHSDGVNWKREDTGATV